MHKKFVFTNTELIVDTKIRLFTINGNKSHTVLLQSNHLASDNTGPY